MTIPLPQNNPLLAWVFEDEDGEAPTRYSRILPLDEIVFQAARQRNRLHRNAPADYRDVFETLSDNGRYAHDWEWEVGEGAGWFHRVAEPQDTVGLVFACAPLIISSEIAFTACAEKHFPNFVIIKINDFQTTGIRISTEALASLSSHGAKISPTNVRDFHDLWFCFV